MRNLACRNISEQLFGFTQLSGQMLASQIQRTYGFGFGRDIEDIDTGEDRARLAIDAEAIARETSIGLLTQEAEAIASTLTPLEMMTTAAIGFAEGVNAIELPAPQPLLAPVGTAGDTDPVVPSAVSPQVGVASASATIPVEIVADRTDNSPLIVQLVLDTGQIIGEVDVGLVERDLDGTAQGSYARNP